MKTVSERWSFQGDFAIRRIGGQIPKTARGVAPVGDYHIVAHSETGHHHVIERARADVYEAADDAFCGWIKSLGDGAEIVHQRQFDTHEALFLPPGAYEFRRQREYTPQGYRRAAD